MGCLMEPGMMIDFAVVVSNLLLVIVTVLAVWASVREGHRHEEKIVSDTEESAERESARMAAIVHEVLRQEHQDSEASKAPAATEPEPAA